MPVLGDARPESFNGRPDVFWPEENDMCDECSDLMNQPRRVKDGIKLTAAFPTVKDQAYEPVNRGRPTFSNAVRSSIPLTKTVEALYRPPSGVRRLEAINGKAREPHRLL